VIAFYAFLAPFIGGGHIWEYTFIAIYSPVVCKSPFLSFHLIYIYYLHTQKKQGLCCLIRVALQALIVFILYVRCTAINPADPGIISKFDPRVGNKFSSAHDLSGKHHGSEHERIAAREQYSPSSAASKRSMSKKSSVEDLDRVDNSRKENNQNSCNAIGGIFCILFSHEDCRKQEATADEQGGGEDALFCTLCNAEVLHCDL